MLVKVQVTQEDITEGVHSEIFNCMVYRALKRIVDEQVLYRAYMDRISFFKKSLPHFSFNNVALPREVILKVAEAMVFQNHDSLEFASYWLGRADAVECRLPEPFEFEIDIPAEYLRMEIPTETLVEA